MSTNKKSFVLWLLLAFPVFIIYQFVGFCKYKANVTNQRKAIKQHIGEKFPFIDVLDTSARETTLNFTEDQITIIDFWFKSCPPCIKEMQQFHSLLKDKNGSVKIISVSINNYFVWKKIICNEFSHVRIFKSIQYCLATCRTQIRRRS